MRTHFEHETIKTSAVVTDSARLGGADRLVTLFTPGHGRLKAVARGARKPGSRYGSGVLPVSHIEVQLVRGRSELFSISGYCPIDDYSDIKLSAARVSQLLPLLGVVNVTAVGREKSEAEFAHIIDTLSLFRAGHKARDIRSYFLFRFFALGGFGLNTESCVGCGKLYSSGPLLVLPSEGIVCSRCAPSRKGLVSMKQADIALVSGMLRGVFPCGSVPPASVHRLAEAHLLEHLRPEDSDLYLQAMPAEEAV